MSRIRDVWVTNLDQEMQAIRDVIQEYPYVSMDTEYPGVVARPIGAFKAHSDYHYQTMRCNVDLLKVIQIGLTLSDAEGRSPEGISTWQFNFLFSVNDDMYAPDSIDTLQASGIDFARHADPATAIEPNAFAERLITSGLVLGGLDDEERGVKWISFHSAYDFGYLLRLLTNAPLPAIEDDFFDVIGMWFPIIFDIKYILRTVRTLKGGLQDIAEELGVQRVGPAHQAGSDSLLVASTFFKMREAYFGDFFDESAFSGQLYGLGSSYHPTASSPSASLTPQNAQLHPQQQTMHLTLPSGQGSAVQLNGMVTMDPSRQPFPTPGLYPSAPVGAFGPSGPGHGMGGMVQGPVMYTMGHGVR